MDKILISIVIPTFKRAAILKEAIDSALNQKGNICNYEVVVVDNEVESDTETKRLIRSYHDKRLRYICNLHNVGMIGNWNRCLEVARGKWVAMLHDDDMLDDNYVERIMYYLRKYPKAGCIIPNHRDIDEKNELTTNKKNRKNEKILKCMKNAVIKPCDLDDKLLCFNYYGCPSCGMIVRKKYALDIGGYDETVGKIFADWDFYLRMRQKYPVYKLNEILGSYRWAENYSLTLNQKRDQELREIYICIDRSFENLRFRNSRFKKYWKRLSKGYAYFDIMERELQRNIQTYFGLRNAFKFKFVLLACIRRIYRFFRCI